MISTTMTMLNRTSGTEDQPNDLTSTQLATVVITLLICIFGLLANLTVMFIILVLQEYKKSVTHWYILQLSIADSVLLLTTPFQVSEELNDFWIYPMWMCKAKDTILYINYYASIMFLMVMSIDRYIAVCHHFSEKLQKFRKPKRAFMLTGCVWVIAILFAIPVMLYATTEGTDPFCKCTIVFPKFINTSVNCINLELSDEECARRDFTSACRPLTNVSLESIDLEDLFSGDYFGEYGSGDSDDIIPRECNYFSQPPAWTAFIAFNFSVMFLLPFLVISICYGLILYRLHETRVRRDNPSRKGSTHGDADRKRVNVMCATLVITFAVCWAPFHTVHLAKLSGIQSSKPAPCVTAVIVGRLFAFLNSALNPYLYSFLGTGCKRKLKSLKSSSLLKPLFEKKKSKRVSKTDGSKLEIKPEQAAKGSVQDLGKSSSSMQTQLTTTRESTISGV